MLVPICMWISKSLYVSFPLRHKNLITLRCSVLSSDVTSSGTSFCRYSIWTWGQITTYDVDTWHAICPCIVLAPYEILGNYKAFWLNHGRKANQQAESYLIIESFWRASWSRPYVSIATEYARNFKFKIINWKHRQTQNKWIFQPI